MRRLQNFVGGSYPADEGPLTPLSHPSAGEHMAETPVSGPRDAERR